MLAYSDHGIVMMSVVAQACAV